MRRSDRQITDYEEILDVIRECDVCRLALNDEGYPYILPLNFGMREENGKIVLYFHGANEGGKYDLIKLDPRASFEMDCAHRLVTDDDNHTCTMEFRSVIGRGIIEILPDDADVKLDALKVLMAHYHKEDFPFGTKILPMTTVMKLTVEEMTAKRRKKA